MLYFGANVNNNQFRRIERSAIRDVVKCRSIFSAGYDRAVGMASGTSLSETERNGGFKPVLGIVGAEFLGTS